MSIVQASAPQVVQDGAAAWDARDFDRLRALYHSDARLGTVSGGGAPLRFDSAIRALAKAGDELDFDAASLRSIELDEHAGVIEGEVRYRPREADPVRQRWFWLHTQVDRLIYRTAICGSLEKARSLYAAYGVSLGV